MPFSRSSLPGFLVIAAVSALASSGCFKPSAATPQPSCPPDQTECGSGEDAYCASLQTEPGNCGICGNMCPEGQVCSAGQCSLDCASGYSACGALGEARF